MATYNGKDYIGEQIDSLLAQSFTNWHLYIHDDGSNDGTDVVIHQYENLYPQQISILDYPSQGCACKNFLGMLETISADYYMFCDQDDVWFPEKIERTFERMKTVEQQNANRPILIHTDLLVVDQFLNTIHPSFIKHQQIHLDKINSFEDYANTNTVTGCTMLFNEQAKQCMKRPYHKAILHDAWICLSVSALNGVIEFIDLPLVKYRQHSNNTLGAHDISQFTIPYKIKHLQTLISNNIRHYREMNAVKPISVWTFMKAKLRYKK